MSITATVDVVDRQEFKRAFAAASAMAAVGIHDLLLDLPAGLKLPGPPDLLAGFTMEIILRARMVATPNTKAEHSPLVSTGCRPFQTCSPTGFAKLPALCWGITAAAARFPLPTFGSARIAESLTDAASRSAASRTDFVISRFHAEYCNEIRLMKYCCSGEYQQNKRPFPAGGPE